MATAILEYAPTATFNSPTVRDDQSDQANSRFPLMILRLQSSSYLLNLPAELLYLILSFLPQSSLPSARLTHPIIAQIVSKNTFSHLIPFLDDSSAQCILEDRFRGLTCQRRMELGSVWSPRCSVPKEVHVTGSFYGALYAAVHGQIWCLCEKSDDAKTEIDERFSTAEIQAAFFRYALWKSYEGTVSGNEIPAITPTMWKK